LSKITAQRCIFADIARAEVPRKGLLNFQQNGGNIAGGVQTTLAAVPSRIALHPR
jgi:hypothetical protein